MKPNEVVANKRTKNKKSSESIKFKKEIKKLIPKFNPLGCEDDDDFKRVYKAVCKLGENGVYVQPIPPKKQVTYKDIRLTYGPDEYDNLDISDVKIN